MNKKQVITLFISIIALVLIYFFTPRYKIIWIDADNFVKTEQTSSLYKRSKGKESLYWDRIALFSGIVIIISVILIFFFFYKKNG